MSEQSWKPMFRSPRSTVTRVLRSPAFLESRAQAAAIIGDPDRLRRLAEEVYKLDHDNAPLSAIADRVDAAVRFLQAKADDLETDGDTVERATSRTDLSAPTGPTGARAARERLIVAALHYLVTPVDLVPDFQIGGYIDDVLLLGWVFGAAAGELDPFLESTPQIGE